MKNCTIEIFRKIFHSLVFPVLIYSSIFPVTKAVACTTILVGKKASADGSVMLGHNEDLGPASTGRLWWQPGEYFRPGSFVTVPYETLPSPRQTYSYWASGNARGSTGLGILNEQLMYDSILTGMNQWGVSMACNWAYSREDNKTKSGIRRYAIRQLILERSRSAFEAVRLIGELTDEYGQADWGGLIYNIADTEEAWVVETTTSQWVARRVSDHEIYAVANRFTIGKQFDLSSRDLIRFAASKGWYSQRDGDFNFRKAYGLPEKMQQRYDTDRERRIHELLDSKKGSIETRHIFQALRDRYQDTHYYTPPQGTVVDRDFVSEHPFLSRPISVNTCQSSSVAHLRGYLPTETGPVMWFSMANPEFSSYFPLYTIGGPIPAAYSTEDGEYSVHSAWWTFKDLQATDRHEYERSRPAVQSFWNSHESSAQRNQEAVETKALKLSTSGQREEALDLLRSFTFEQSLLTLQKANHLKRQIKTAQ